MTLQNIAKSDNVKFNFGRAGASIKKTGREVTTATTVCAYKLTDELSGNEEFKDGIDGSSEGLKVLAAAASVVSTRIVDQAKKLADELK